MKNSIQIREIETGDTKIIASAFQAIGCNKPESQYHNYLKEQEIGKRVVLLAFREGKFAGYGNIIWSSSYSPFQQKGIPEISDLNVLPQFRRKGIATAIMDRAEVIISKRSDYAGIGFGLYNDYGAAQRLYVLRGYVPDGLGTTYEWKPVLGGQQVRADDKFVLWLVKKLKTKR
jgi:ribosomal protein S18 acetylase RimI-like enzyme